MNTIRLSMALALSLALSLGAAPHGASAQPARPAPARPAPAATPQAAGTPAAVPAAPQQTTAVFADWVLRCTRLDAAAPATPSAAPAPLKVCEVVQGIQRDDKPVAQIALGHPGKGTPLQLTVLVPSNVAFGAGPVLLPGKEGEAAPMAELAWRRCLPAGCLADVALSDEALRLLRGWTDAGRIAFQDGTGRTAVMPFSPRGLPQALDALAKEDAS